MSMLTLNGTVQNVFDKPESKDRETGEIRPGSTQAQILAENILESGEKRLEMVTLKVHAGEAFRKLVGQFVRVPVGAFVAQGTIKYYALKNESSPVVGA
jgi:hypothetical protein